MAIIKSGNSFDNLTVNATSKAVRVTEYGKNKRPVGSYSDTVQYNPTKWTYRATSTAANLGPAAAGYVMTIRGCDQKLIKIQRICYSLSISTAAKTIPITVALLQYDWTAGGQTSEF